MTPAARQSGWMMMLAPCALLAALPATAQDNSFALRAKEVYPVTVEQPGPIRDGVILVRGGRIVAVGANLEIPPDLPLIDLRDEVVCPGFVDAASGLVSAHSGDESVSGAYAAIDAYDVYGSFVEQLAMGTTTVHLSPGGHRLVSGRGAVVKLAGDATARALKPEADLSINLGTFNPPPLIAPPFYASSDVAIAPGQWQRPASRLGQLLELDERIGAIAAPPRDEPRPDPGLIPTGIGFLQERRRFDFHGTAFAQAWVRGLPLRIQVRRAADIESALAFVQKHQRPATLVGVGEGDELAEGLRKSNLPIVVRLETAYRFPDFNAGPDPLAFVPRAQVVGALASDAAGGGPSRMALAGMEYDALADLAMIAALAVRGGLSLDRALAAITRVPAEILGVESRVGSLAPGKDADLLVLSAAPLAAESRVLRVYVNGALAYAREPVVRGRAAGPAGPNRPRPIVVKAGTIWVGNGQVIQDGSLLIEDGKIKAVGHRVPRPALAKVIDAGRDAFVTPGFIDAHGHLGLGEWGVPPDQRTIATPDLAIFRTVGVAGREFLRVAQAGVTTVMLAAYRTADAGSRVAAVKTYGGDRDDMVTRATAAVKFSLAGKDPVFGVNPIKEAIEAAKKYEESWKKYADELEKWNKDKDKGAEGKPKADVETRVEEGKPDPITGTWEFRLTGGPLPEPVTGTMILRLTGTKIEGKATAPGGDQEADLVGTLEGNRVTLEIDEDIPLGRPRVTATLDREDHMAGALKIGEMMSLDFEATRTDKSPVEFKVERHRKSRKDGRPEPPPVNENLEPLRPLLAGAAPALVEVRTAAETVAALKLFVDAYKIPVVLLDAPDASDVADELARRKEHVGVIVPSQVVRRRDRVAYHQAADLASRGIRVAWQSDSEDGARALPLMGLYAVREGMGGDDALRALTVEAAKLYKLDDRLGTLEPGKDADMLIHSGHPFDTGSRLERVIVGGYEVPHDE